jgi:hypothetical protein
MSPVIFGNIQLATLVVSARLKAGAVVWHLAAPNWSFAVKEWATAFW